MEELANLMDEIICLLTDIYCKLDTIVGNGFYNSISDINNKIDKISIELSSIKDMDEYSFWLENISNKLDDISNKLDERRM